MKETKPESIIVTHKPVANNHHYPYFSLDHRAFELLLYSLFQNEISYGDFKGVYDDIWLMEGVREQGRDCSLYKDGKLAGVVQCKHRSTIDRVGKVEVAKEIIKFLLHLIHNKKPVRDHLDYYFVVSSEFDGKARELLEDFNNNIFLEPDLDKWTQAVIKENKGLEKLELPVIKAELHGLLISLKVSHKASTDITLLLNKSFNTGVSAMFFSIKVVVEEATVLKGMDKIQSSILGMEAKMTKPTLSTTQLIEQFIHSSFFLSTYRNEFFSLPESHLERSETTEIYEWIKNPLPAKAVNENILLLTGNAGYGKSVVLKDLWEKLHKDEIPVLGIKADRFPVGSIKELEEKLNLKDDLYAQLERLCSEFERVVVLIDQVDALSQTLSSQRDALNAYRLLINSIQRIPNVRIVISLRTFDLNYDPDLQFYKNQKTVWISLLTEAQVDTILQRLHIHPGSVSSSLKSLLRTPHHLNVFCKIIKSGFAIETIKTLQDLYQELWQQTLAHVPTERHISSASVKECLQTLARDMNTKQQISLVAEPYTDRFGKEIEYLSSEGIISFGKNALEYFHQTYYDFIFAKSFVESGQSTIAFIRQSRNSLFIRSSLKMILGFLREQHHAEYLRTVETILISRRFLFHIKLLVYNLLGFVEEPSLGELEFIRIRLLPRRTRQRLFFESVYSEKLLQFLIDQKAIDGLLNVKPTLKQRVVESLLGRKINARQRLEKRFRYIDVEEEQTNAINLWYSLLGRHLPQSRKLVVTYLSMLPDVSNKEGLIFRLLYGIKHWDFPEAFALFERYQQQGYSDSFQFFQILQDAADTNPTWVMNLYKPFLFAEIETKTSVKKAGHDSYQEEELFKKLFAVAPVETFKFGFEIIDRVTEKKKLVSKVESTLDEDELFYLYDYNRHETERGTYMQLYTLMVDTIGAFEASNRLIFEKWYDRLIGTNKVAFYKMLVYSFNNQSEKLEDYRDDVFGFIRHVSEKNALTFSEKFEFHLRRALQKYFPFFSADQQAFIMDMILMIKDPSELYKHNWRGKPDFLRNYGLTKYKYFSALPRQEIVANPKTKKLFLELERRYGKVKDSEPYRVRAYSVGPPLSQGAYEHMDFAQWLKSFEKYNSDDPRFDDHPERGGLTENYRAFKAAVEKRPAHFLPFVEQLFHEHVHPAYFVAGLDGLKAGKVSPPEFRRLFKLALKIPVGRFETMQLLWMADYLIEANAIDEEILDFMIQQAISHPDPAEPFGEPQHQALNTVRGAAVERLTRVDFNPQWSERIFATLSKVAEDPQVSVKVSLVMQLAYLMNLDKERTLAIFLKVTEQYQPDVYRSSIWSVQYLANYKFEQLLPFFRNCLSNSEGLEEAATIIAVAYLNEKRGSEELMKELFTKSDELKAKVIHVGWVNILDKEKKVRQRAVTLFLKGRYLTSDKIIHAYSIAFLKWEPKHFNALYPTIYAYSRSKAGRHDLHYYYEYLLKCLKDEPEKCLRLISNIRKHQQPKHGRRMIEEEPVKLAIGIFNSLEKLPGKRKLADKALKIFNYLLQDPYYRRTASKVTEQVER